MFGVHRDVEINVKRSGFEIIVLERISNSYYPLNLFISAPMHETYDITKAAFIADISFTAEHLKNLTAKLT